MECSHIFEAAHSGTLSFLRNSDTDYPQFVLLSRSFETSALGEPVQPHRNRIVASMH